MQNTWFVPLREITVSVSSHTKSTQNSSKRNKKQQPLSANRVFLVFSLYPPPPPPRTPSLLHGLWVWNSTAMREENRARIWHVFTTSSRAVAAQYVMDTTTFGLHGFPRGAHWLERRTRDRKVPGSSPGKSGGRIFFHRINFLCGFLFRCLFQARVTAAAHKTSRSFCQKCRWQIIAKNA